MRVSSKMMEEYMRKIRRVLSIMLCFVLCCTMSFAFSGKPVKAATKITNDSWIDAGIYTRAWMNTKTQTDIYGNDGSEEQPYVIKNAKDFAALSYYSYGYSMTFEGKYITIEASEIDLAQHYWFPIGAATQFKGNITGNGCVIKNVFIGNKSEYSTVNYNGLFGNMAGSISDLNVKDFMYYVNSNYIGGLVGYCERGYVKNCTIQGEINNQHSNTCIGGVIGYRGTAGDDIENCSANVTINSNVNASENRNEVGGLIGFIANKANILNCKTSGEIKTGNYHTVGGLVGHNQAPVVTKNCSANVTINTGSTSFAGGLIGCIYYTSPSIMNCYALGNVFTEGSSNVGGFIGFGDSSTITFQDCYAKGDVSAHTGSSAGGFIGTGSSTITYQNCYAKGNVSAYASSYVGGFAGGMYNDTVKQCGALGNAMAGNSSYAGGFVGYIHSANIVNSYSLGDAKAELNSNVGGFCGYHYTTASITNCYAKGGVQAGTGSAIGGFIASKYKYNNNMTLKRCYWNKTAEQKLDQVSWKESQKIAVGYNPSNKIETTTEEFMKTKGFAEYLNEFVEQSEVEYDSWKISDSLNNGYPFTAPLGKMFFDIAGGNEEISISEKEDSKDKEMGVYGTFVYPEIPVSEKPVEPAPEPEDHPIHISLEWGTLEYQYTSGDYDEASNTYADGTWAPKEAGVSDLIRVINKSESDIKANFAYVPSDANEGNYLNIKGQFEDYEVGKAVNGNVIVSAKEDDVELSKVVRFSLTGVPERRVDNGLPEQIGKIVLTVSKYIEPTKEPTASEEPATSEDPEITTSVEPSKEPVTSEEPQASAESKEEETTVSAEPSVVPVQSEIPENTEVPVESENTEESEEPKETKDVEESDESASPEPSPNAESSEL